MSRFLASRHSFSHRRVALRTGGVCLFMGHHARVIGFHPTWSMISRLREMGFSQKMALPARDASMICVACCNNTHKDTGRYNKPRPTQSRTRHDSISPP
jgi:hypothetical protein